MIAAVAIYDCAGGRGSRKVVGCCIYVFVTFFFPLVRPPMSLSTLFLFLGGVRFSQTDAGLFGMLGNSWRTVLSCHSLISAFSKRLQVIQLSITRYGKDQFLEVSLDKKKKEKAG